MGRWGRSRERDQNETNTASRRGAATPGRSRRFLSLVAASITNLAGFDELGRKTLAWYKGILFRSDVFSPSLRKQRAALAAKPRLFLLLLFGVAAIGPERSGDQRPPQPMHAQ